MDKLISSEKLIHDLSGIRDTLPDIFLKNVMSAAISCVEKQPTVDAESVRRARWKYGVKAAVCSECGFERHLDDNFGAAIACPNCGFRMDY